VPARSAATGDTDDIGRHGLVGERHRHRLGGNSHQAKTNREKRCNKQFHGLLLSGVVKNSFGVTRRKYDSELCKDCGNRATDALTTDAGASDGDASPSDAGASDANAAGANAICDASAGDVPTAPARA
jgi:hypothetical protein